MTPGARLAAAIEILDRLLTEGSGGDPFEYSAAPLTGVTADQALRDWGRGARYAGSKDRAAVADIVYAALRRLGSAGLAVAADGRAVAMGGLRLDGASVEEIAALADGGPHRPSPLSDAEADRLERLVDMAAAAPGADFPEWLYPALAASVAEPQAEIAALARRAAFDLRVNTLKATPEQAAAALAEQGLDIEPGPLAPGALRVRGLGGGGRPKLSGLAAYAEGLVEPQDAASQAAALLAASFLKDAPEERSGLAVDVCAGGGGKTLALAAALPAGASLCAFDVAAKRMADLPARLSRAGASARILDRAGLEALAGEADLALVDAPCSGSGAWARQPDAKWRLTPDRLDQLCLLQQQALDLGAETLRPGGVLVYVTCSLLKLENADSVSRFLERRPEFARESLAGAWSRADLAGSFDCCRGDAGGEDAVLFSPSRTATDGFFVAALRHGATR